MKVIIQSGSIGVTKAIRSFCQKHCKKLLSRGVKVKQITVFLDTVVRKKNDAKAASAKLHISIPGKNIIIRRQAHDLYNAIADVVNRAQGLMVKKNQRRKQKRRHNHDLGVDWVEWAY